MRKFKPSILIVDDSKASLALIADLLEGFHVEIHTALGAKPALEVLDIVKIHIIISDVNMPGMDGFTFARKIRENPNYASIPLIFISGSYTDEIHQNLGLQLGALDYILKETIDQTLPQKVRNLLEILRFQNQLENDMSSIRVVEESHKENILNMAEELTNLKSASSLKSQMLMILSHQIRSPLGTILNAAEILEAKKGEIDQVSADKLFNYIKKAVFNINNLLEKNTLSLKAISGQLICDFSYQKLDSYFNEIVDEVSVAHNNFKIDVTINGIENKSYIIDAYHLKIVIENLLTNAIKYSGEKKEVKAKFEVNNSNLKITVQDFGIGIPDSLKPKLFETFQRGDNTQGIQGTGIGLAIVKNILNALEGTIEIDSILGQGTTFYINIPIKDTI